MKLRIAPEVWMGIGITVIPLVFIQALHITVHEHNTCKTEDEWLRTLDPDIQSLIKNRSYSK